MSNTIPRTLKGFRDFLPLQKSGRDHLEHKIVGVFERFGFQPVETPTLEYAALILSKYGEDADRLVYAFEDKGGRQVALPYDQTVPTARVLAQYQRELPRFFRRYSIKNVFRAENPQKGRYREFKQCDIDIYGSASPLADAEIVACTWAAFHDVGFADTRVRINDRRLLLATLQPFASGAVDVFSIIRSIDKLDKVDHDAVVEELVSKGLDPAAARAALREIAGAQPPADLRAILEAVRDLGVPGDAVEFSPMLARGLDYYTGAIFEVVVPGFGSGSLAGGGRYDNLIEQLGGPATPAVGIAFGFDRMVEAAEQLSLLPADVRSADVLATVFDAATTPAALSAAAALRGAGVRVEVHVGVDKLGRQFKLGDQKGIPLALIVGPDEAAAGTSTVRNLRSGEQRTVARDELVASVRAMLAAL